MDAWDADTAPKRVLGAILEQFAFQYRFRGDDVESNDRDRHAVLCPNAEALLTRFRDPAIG